MRNLILYTLILFQVSISGQVINVEFENFKIIRLDSKTSFLSFSNSNIDQDLIAFSNIQLQGRFNKNYNIINIESTALTEQEKALLQNFELSYEPKIDILNGKSRNQHISNIKIYPYYLKEGKHHKVLKIEIELSKLNIPETLKFKSTNDLENSVLSSGHWFKFKVEQEGLQKITFEDLIKHGVLSAPISHEKISIHSRSSKMLSFFAGKDERDNLIQTPIQFNNLINDEFGEGSSLLFFAESNGHRYVDENGIIRREINLYSDSNYVFLNIESDNYSKLETINYSTATDTLFDFAKDFHHEMEWTNFIKSGREWFGEPFIQNPLNFKIPYHKPIKNSFDAIIEFRACARSNIYTNNKISLIFDQDTLISGQMNKVSSVYYNDYVKFTTKSVQTYNLPQSNDSLNIKLFYHQTDNPLAWLDYILINSNERILVNETFNSFILKKNDKYTNVNVLSDISIKSIWDITELDKVHEVNVSINDSGFTFNTLLDTNRKFIVQKNFIELKPTFIKKIENQNLQNAEPANYIIITTPEFKNQAERLIKLHKEYDNLSGNIFHTENIYNEYSSGRPEAMAIRNFIKNIYDKGKETNDSLQYVLLLGDGSYDPKNRIANNINYIPTFQSLNSIKLTSSYVTDDFYGLLDENEGDYQNGDLLDIGVGRIPAKNENEAEKVIDKIFEYYDVYDLENITNELEKELLTSKGEWKNNILFVADDEDFNEHMRQADELAQNTDINIKDFNIRKIYVDAFPQEDFSIGKLSPAANNKLINSLEEGNLIVNYTGHGGELGWTEEQIFLVKDIKSLKNRNRLPLFMTATCEFSRFDSPEHTSAGELLLLQPQGGSIALFSTVRLVFSIPNFKLNQTFYDVLKSSISNKEIRLGDIFRKTKVQNNGGTNDRNFTLLGDPALKLAFPLYDIKLDSIKIENSHVDSLKALETPVLFGKVLNKEGVFQSNYNGYINISLFDKKKEVTTLGDDEQVGPFTYDTQEYLIFKGKALVKEGMFSTKIFIPKDTRQNFDIAKLSFYAVDNKLGDATGHDTSFVLGGTNKTNNSDNQGPEVEIFLDDSTFVFGDNVSSSPIFIANLTDSSGINIISNDIGRDITLVVDESNEMIYTLNDYYSPSVYSFQNGKVIFPLDELEEGRHSLVFKVFDNQNNQSKAYTEFIIEKNPELALQHILNYPNPFTTKTGFYFEHNQTSEDLDVLIEIFTISGKLVKSINSNFSASNRRIGPINWDGRDEYGDQIGRGVYIYKVNVRNSRGETKEAIEKLVLLQ